MHDLGPDSWGLPLPPDNRTFDGIIGYIAAGHADMSTNDMTLVPERTAVVDFSWPYLAIRLHFVLRKPEQVSSAFSFARSFSTPVRS